MLISQQVQINSAFLKTLVKNPIFSLSEVKTKILNSVKILIGNEFLNIDEWDSTDNALKKMDKLKPTDKEKEKKRNLYLQFGKLPFPSMFIENETGGLLVERVQINTQDVIKALETPWAELPEEAASDHRVWDTMITVVSPRGYVEPTRILMNTSDCIDDPSTKNMILPTQCMFYNNPASVVHLLRAGKSLLTDGDIFGEHGDIVMGYHTARAYVYGAALFEALLYMNASNTVLVPYKPTKKELKDIPKVLQPKYEYKILDVYRTKKQYDSMADVLATINQPEAEKQLRRAHVVRGHFKNKHGKLFWWSDFMRNRKNKDTIGIVKKDYYLADPEPPASH